MTGVTKGKLRQQFRDQLAAAGETDPGLRIMADAFIEIHVMLCKAAADLGKALKTRAETHPVAKQLMSIPGVGPIVSLSFIALIEDPNRFMKPSDVGAYLGLTPRRYQSGEIDWSGRISKGDDNELRP
jgi:transposase